MAHTLKGNVTGWVRLCQVEREKLNKVEHDYYSEKTGKIQRDG